MRLPLYWKMVLGFGIIVVAMVVVHGYILVNLDDVYTAVTTTVATDVAAINTAQELHPLLDEEELYAEKYLAVRDTMYARLRHEAHRHVRLRLDSLEHTVNSRAERSLLAAFRRTHDWLAHATDSRTRAPSAVSEQLADTMDVLHARIDHFIQLNQQVIATTAANVETNTTHAMNVGLWLVLGSLTATVGVAFFITRTITKPISQLRHGTERIARGEYQSVPVRGHDEIGTLAVAFNDMSDRLKRIDEYKAEMMQQISHELRTPLQAMHAAYYMLAEQIAGPLNERQLRLVTTIRDNIDALSTFSNQFLDLSKIEAGMMEFHRQQVDLLTLLTPIINTARVMAAPKEITIGLAAQSVPPVNIDPEKFSTVATNLLSNAVKFTQKGGNITVTVAPCGNGARVAVKDSGIGIDADDLPKLFTKFFQAKSASAVSVKGTGVGLALVKAIMDGHGGKVYATSTVGVGSTFTVEIPSQSTGSLPHAPQPN